MDPNAGKKGLHNKKSPEELRKLREAENFKRRTVSFYRYVKLGDPRQLRDELYAEWWEMDCLGRVYLAGEGINAQMSVPEHHWQNFADRLYARPQFAGIPFKIALEETAPSFLKLTVKVRPKIVADGLNEEEWDVTNVGRHLTAREWNEAMESGRAIVVDMRNHYESEIGHFEGAVLPESETFREELPEVLEKLRGQEDRKVLLYCTGGIRCEKTSAYLRHHGFEDVNQLHGGIIDYARQIKEEKLPNKFRGKNFVFDQRLGERVDEQVIARCHQCGTPCDTHVNCANQDCNLLFIQCKACAEAMDGCCSQECVDYRHLPAEEQARRRQQSGPGERFRSHRKVDVRRS